MYIREKIKTGKDGATYRQHQLIESVRTPAGPRQSLVLNLGTLSLDRDKWKELANRTEALLHGPSSLFESDPEVERLAEHYAKVVRLKRLSVKREEVVADEGASDYETVDLHSVENSDVLSVGTEHVALSQVREYGFDKLLSSLGLTPKQIVYAKMLVVSRLVHPSSERETARWLRENSGLSELLGDDGAVYDTALHRAASSLWDHHEAIEKALSHKAKGLYSLEETVILYDLTNTYFEGSKRGSAIAKPGGKSKERRNDRPLVTLALAVDGEGFPKGSRVLEGNVSEPGTLERMLNELDTFSHLLNSMKTVVIDAGIATEENLKLIRSKGFSYVAVSRKRAYDEGFWDDSEERRALLADGKTSLTMRLSRKDGEAFILCHSEAKEAKEKAIGDKKMRRFEEEIARIREGLKKKGTRKKHDQILERIGRLKEKYRVGSLYDLSVVEKGGIVSDLLLSKNAKGKAAEDFHGKYVLRTDRLDLKDEEISKIHRSLTTIEASFRSMKAELGMRPNFHKKDKMTKAHIHLTVIAYHLLAPILKKLQAKGLNYCWNTVRELLKSHVRVTTTFKTKEGNTVNMRMGTTPTQKQKDIYDALKIRHNPLKRVKTVVLGKKM